MARLRFLADEHVPRVFTNVLRSNGFDVLTAQEWHGQENVDHRLLEDCASEGIVVLINDRDFVRMADENDHAGIVMYTDRRFLVAEPMIAVEAVAEIDRYYSPGEMRNTVEWLDNWR